MATMTAAQALESIKTFNKIYLPTYTAKYTPWESELEERFSIYLNSGKSLQYAYDREIATAISGAGVYESAYPSNPKVIGIDPIALVNTYPVNEVINYLYPSISAADKSTLQNAISSGTLTITDFGSAMSILKSTTSTPTAAEIIKAPIQLTAAANLPESSLHLAGLTDGQQDFLVSMYIGAFGRAPDNGGLKYWGNELYTDMTALGMGQHSAYLAVGQNMYKAGTENGEGGTQLQNAEFINFAYNNALGRTADTGGFNYWLNDLNSGNVARADFLTTFLTAGQNDERDANYLAYRVAVGEFAAQKHVSDAGIDPKAVLIGVTDQASALTAINGIIQKYGSADVAAIQLTGVQVDVSNNLI